MEHDFEYVNKIEYGPVKKELEELIHLVQDDIRDEYFTFSYSYVGSSSKNRRMITRDRNSNIGYDFDVNIHVNDDDEDYDAREIRQSIIMKTFNKFAGRFGYDFCEDHTRVFTIKKKNYYLSSIIHSCDFAIVYDCNDGRQQYIHYNKEQRSYCWEYLPVADHRVEEKADWLKNPKHNHWQEVRERYLEKKDNNTDENQRSRSLYRQTINEIYQKYHK